MFNLSMSVDTNGVSVHTTQNRGFTPEEIAERCVNKIISVSDSANPILKDQANAFRKNIMAVIVFYLKEAVKSDRTTVCKQLIDAGQPELAEVIRRI